MKISAQQLCEILKGELDGNADVIIEAPAKIEDANQHQVSFIANPKYESYANKTNAGALIVSKTFVSDSDINSTLIKVDNPYECFGMVLEMYNRETLDKSGIEEPAYISATATLGENIYLGAFCYLGENVKLGDNVKLFPNVFIGDDSIIGDNTIIFSGVNIYHKSKIGNNCIVHAGAVIGSDGFGFIPKPDGSYHKVPQTGNVVIEENVEIGANTVIDRATLGSTIIRKGVKLDNLIQVAHNVVIGKNTAIAAQAGISGSTQLGKNCMIGGQVGLVGHLNIADGTKVNAQSGVVKNIKEKGTAWMGSPAFDYHQNLKSQVIFRNLPELEKRVRELEQRIQELNRTESDD